MTRIIADDTVPSPDPTTISNTSASAYFVTVRLHHYFHALAHCDNTVLKRLTDCVIMLPNGGEQVLDMELTDGHNKLHSSKRLKMSSSAASASSSSSLSQESTATSTGSSDDADGADEESLASSATETGAAENIVTLQPNSNVLEAANILCDLLSLRAAASTAAVPTKKNSMKSNGSVATAIRDTNMTRHHDNAPELEDDDDEMQPHALLPADDVDGVTSSSLSQSSCSPRRLLRV